MQCAFLGVRRATYLLVVTVTLLFGGLGFQLAATVYADQAVAPSNSFLIGQPGTNSYLGYPTVLDFNGDSQKDFAFRASPEGQNSSEVVEVVANNGNLPAQIDLNSPQNVLLTITNIQTAPDTTHPFFWALTSAGDMNGDGKDDLLLFPHVDPTSSSSEYAHTQYAYLVWGGQSGTISLDSFTTTNGVRFKATELYNSEYLLPRSVGDVNGDEYNDIAFGDFTKSPFNPNSYDGQTHVVYGRPGAWPAQIDLDNLSAADGYQITGAFNSNSGLAIAAAGDVNHDGISDILITDESYTGYTGKVFVVFGSSQTQNVSLASLGSRGYKIFSINHPISDFVHIIALGDINDDGMGDLAIANWYSDPSTQSGQNAVIYIVHGKADTADVNLDSSPLVQSTIHFQQSPMGDFPFSIRALQSTLVIATGTNSLGQAPPKLYALPLASLPATQTLSSSDTGGSTIPATASDGTTEYFGDDIADSLVDGKLLLTSSAATSNIGAVLVPVANIATVSDTQAPTITYSVSPPPANGWNNTAATVTFSCSDAESGVHSCSLPQTESSDGVYSLTGYATDNAGNSSSIDAVVKIDTTAPTVGTASWSNNPIAALQQATLTVPASDNLSGIVGGEYYLGADPGVGNGTPMSSNGSNLSASIGSNLQPGVYSIGYRAKDAAGNWSTTLSTMLVIYDNTTGLKFTGKNRNDLVPSLARGDILPGLISATQSDPADYGFTAQYKNGSIDTHSDFAFTYATGSNCNKQGAQNCHTFSVNATSISWLIFDQPNNSHGRIQGVATVNIDGVASTNPFTLEGTDGDRLTPSSDDSLLLKIFAPGSDPSTSTPIYRASGTITTATAVKIQ
ncbi:MAG TPA: integrin alpha [Candidatus Saccharimonadales bacterium]|nr:integrin alpha [Candidatus Saccharimonadales bacterium]